MEFHALMRRAIELARQGIAAGESPFAAVIAKPDATIVAGVHNVVRATCDITAHAEMHAIREACRALGTINLAGHVMVTTCEPCPMCASAIHWARLDAVAFGATIADAERAGFHELHVSIDELYGRGGGRVRVIRDLLRDECAALFDEWGTGPRPIPY
jgi:guanine deaminase